MDFCREVVEKTFNFLLGMSESHTTNKLSYALPHSVDFCQQSSKTLNLDWSIEEGVQNDRSLLTLSRLREFASQFLHFRCGEEEEEEIALFNKSLCNPQRKEGEKST